MKLLPPPAILCGAAAAAVAASLCALGPAPLAAGLGAAGLAGVAFAAQSRRLRGENRAVYRPVYARRHGARRRAGLDG